MQSQAPDALVQVATPSSCTSSSAHVTVVPASVVKQEVGMVTLMLPDTVSMDWYVMPLLANSMLPMTISPDVSICACGQVGKIA
jgi:hypothetical protein